jgi:hypothetical protein
MLVRLIYASRAASPMGEGDLAAVLRQSRRNNPPKGITGVLCHSDGVFVQMLEGSREVVNALYSLIVTDNRHKDVTLLDYCEISERRFAGWNMGHVNLSRLNPGLVLKYSATAKLDPYSMSGRALTALFDELIAAGVIVCT